METPAKRTRGAAPATTTEEKLTGDADDARAQARQKFAAGEFAFQASASAVAVEKGDGGNVDYSNGVAVFTEVHVPKLWLRASGLEGGVCSRLAPGVFT